MNHDLADIARARRMTAVTAVELSLIPRRRSRPRRVVRWFRVLRRIALCWRPRR
ncbi:hypothetical protein [Roseivivax sediminis]|uniref:Uncharacterized protein n=1 Tax=Roseivivax sediminis TaxID=936889 RepID=A0A1I1URI4_9RHOB|nr:hypothetical protein [Roseivivax sediminis]SFD71413.1 hypothetical protein SAMN04515678_102399 [Roseivivax sediminis]